MKKRKNKQMHDNRFKRVTSGLIVFHRLSMGWDDSGKLEFDVCFKHMVGSDSLQGELRRITVENAIDMKRHWMCRVNVYCKDSNGEKYIETAEAKAVHESLQGLEPHILACKEEALSAVNPKHIYDLEWIATPIQTLQQELSDGDWQIINKRIDRQIKRRDEQAA